MSIYVTDLYPKVFCSNCRQSLYVKFESDGAIDSTLLKIKIQPMEKYSVPHTKNYRIDEEDRYPYVSLNACGYDLYYTEYEFIAEQQYSVKIKYDGKYVQCTHIYAVDDDLANLKVFKGDTHLHTCRSDGQGTPFEVACNYRAAGYDFIAITDHHKFAPSLEAQDEIKALTNEFFVFTGEEVHNKNMGYFHIINFGGNSSVNDIIETDDTYVETEIQKILNSRDFSMLSDPRCTAYRIFITDHIRKANGVAIMAHPFWETYGEYHMQTEEFVYHWQNGDFDALEVIAACDGTGNGNNLQEMLRCDMLVDGYKIPVVGSSDAHTTVNKLPIDLFNKQFTLCFAKDFNDIPSAIKSERSVAIDCINDTHFHAVGKFRYAKYARFLIWEYYALYAKLCRKHAKALASKNMPQIKEIEKEIAEFKYKFFNF